MSLEQQIEEAWKENEPSFYHDVEYSASSMLETSKECFEAGYRAALTSLYVEVRPENMRPGETYLMLVDGEWIERQCVTVEYLRQLAGFADKIYRLSLPSPSSVFGGGA